MPIQFTKMHGLGNDFMVVDTITQPGNIVPPEQIPLLADRHFGVGFDQLLLVEPPQKPDVDFRYRIFNADGSEVEQCGNGARCFARFVRDNGLCNKDRIRVETLAGVMTLKIGHKGQVTVNMGIPQLSPASIPFDAPEQATRYAIDADGKTWDMGVVSMGNPHGVLLVDDIDKAPVETLGPLLENHPRFPQRANIGFLAIESRRRARLRVWERGVGETLACGSGACAAMVVGRLRGLLNSRVDIRLPGGKLHVTWRGGSYPVKMSGPAAKVYQGEVLLPLSRP